MNTPAPAVDTAPRWRLGPPAPSDVDALLAPYDLAALASVQGRTPLPRSGSLALFLATLLIDGVASPHQMTFFLAHKPEGESEVRWLEKRDVTWWPVVPSARSAAFSFVPLDLRTCLPVPWPTHPAPELCATCGGALRTERLAVPACLCGVAEFGL